MAHEKLRPEYFFDEAKIEQLKQLAPECFEDGKINFETLRQNLGDRAQDEDDAELEHFGLFWPGKRDARRIAAIPPEGTLEPVYGEGLKADGTPDTDGQNDSRNIFIEGENLEVLKILQKSYANKIKMIYIDPPYNTGKDFIYDDNFTEPLQEYLRRTGQVDEEGNPLTTNKRSDGRFHSKWLSMMYPRLRLARNLLCENGVIFLSIDDNEVHNLRAIMNEIFGEENIVAELVWQKRKGGGNDSTFIARDHEYVLIYAKNVESNDKWRVPYEEKYLKRYKEVDEKGRYYWDTLTREGLQSPIIYDIECPNGSVIKNGKWQISEKTFLQKKIDGDIRFSLNSSGSYTVHHKIRQPEGRVFRSVILDVVNSDAADEMEALFGVKKIFDNPKPSELIKNILLIAAEEDDIVLDFFAGSSTTAEAVFQINENYKKNLKWLNVQLPHEISSETEAGKNALNLGYTRITEMAKDRLRKSIKLSKYTNSGFKVLVLNNSSYKKWQDFKGSDIANLESTLDLFNQSPLRSDWNKNKLLTEILLLEGFPLDSILQKNTVGKNEVYRVQTDEQEHQLLVCMDEKIDDQTIAMLQLNSHVTFICLDSAISNVNKLRLSDKGLIKTI